MSEKKCGSFNVQIKCCMLWELFCQSFVEQRYIKQVLFFLCAFSFYYGNIFLGKSHYCDCNFKIPRRIIRFVKDSIYIEIHVVHYWSNEIVLMAYLILIDACLKKNSPHIQRQLISLDLMLLIIFTWSYYFI
jgi:hypothetical protein